MLTVIRRSRRLTLTTRVLATPSQQNKLLSIRTANLSSSGVVSDSESHAACRDNDSVSRGLFLKSLGRLRAAFDVSTANVNDSAATSTGTSAVDDAKTRILMQTLAQMEHQRLQVKSISFPGWALGAVITELGHITRRNPAHREIIRAVFNDQWIHQWWQYTSNCLAACNPRDLSSILNGFSLLSIEPPEEWTQQLWHTCLQQVLRFDPKTLTCVLKMLWRHGVGSKTLLVAASRRDLMNVSLQHLQSTEGLNSGGININYMLAVPAAFHALGIQPSKEWYSQYFLRLDRTMMETIDESALTMLPNMVIQVGVPPECIPISWISDYLHVSLTKIDNYGARRIATLLSSLASIGKPPLVLQSSLFDDWINGLLAVHTRQLLEQGDERKQGEIGNSHITKAHNITKHICQTIASLQTLKLEKTRIPPAWGRALIYCCEHTVFTDNRSFSATELGIIASGVGQLIAEPPSKRWIRGLLASIHSTPISDPTVAANLLTSLVAMGVTPQNIPSTYPLFVKFSTILKQHMTVPTIASSTMSMKGLLTVMRAYEVIKTHPDRFTSGWMEAFLQHTLPALRAKAMSPGMTGALAQSLKVLRPLQPQPISGWAEWKSAYKELMLHQFQQWQPFNLHLQSGLQYSRQNRPSSSAGRDGSLVAKHHDLIQILALAVEMDQRMLRRDTLSLKVIAEGFMKEMLDPLDNHNNKVRLSGNGRRFGTHCIAEMLLLFSKLQVSPGSLVPGFNDAMFRASLVELESMITLNNLHPSLSSSQHLPMQVPLLDLAGLLYSCGVLNIPVPLDWAELLLKVTEKVLKQSIRRIGSVVDSSRTSNSRILKKYEVSQLIYGIAMCDIAPPASWLQSFRAALLELMATETGHQYEELSVDDEDDTGAKIIQRAVTAHHYFQTLPISSNDFRDKTDEGAVGIFTSDECNAIVEAQRVALLQLPKLWLHRRGSKEFSHGSCFHFIPEICNYTGCFLSRKNTVVVSHNSRYFLQDGSPNGHAKLLERVLRHANYNVVYDIASSSSSHRSSDVLNG